MAKPKNVQIWQIILKMYKKGFGIEQIAEAADKNTEDVKAMIEGRELVLA